MTPTSSRANHGALKTFCERLVQKTYADNPIIRPGLIVGSLDPSDRFTYWPVSIDQGGEVLASGQPSDPVQIIDSRDLWPLLTDYGCGVNDVVVTAPGFVPYLSNHARRYNCVRK